MGLAAIIWPGSMKKTFVPPSQAGPTWNFDFDWHSGFWEKMFENAEKDEIWVTFDQGQRMTLTSNTFISSYICLFHFLQ